MRVVFVLTALIVATSIAIGIYKSEILRFAHVWARKLCIWPSPVAASSPPEIRFRIASLLQIIRPESNGTIRVDMLRFMPVLRRAAQTGVIDTDDLSVMMGRPATDSDVARVYRDCHIISV